MLTAPASLHRVSVRTSPGVQAPGSFREQPWRPRLHLCSLLSGRGLHFSPSLTPRAKGCTSRTTALGGWEGPGAWKGADLPGAGGAAGGRVRGGPAAQPVAVEVGGGVVDGEALLVALAHFGEDVDPGLGLHAVVGLDVQRSLRLDDLEHLRTQSMGSGHRPSGITGIIIFNAYRLRGYSKGSDIDPDAQTSPMAAGSAKGFLPPLNLKTEAKALPLQHTGAAGAMGTQKTHVTQLATHGQPGRGTSLPGGHQGSPPEKQQSSTACPARGTP